MKKSGVMGLLPLLVAAIVLILGTATCSDAAAPSNVLYSAPGAEGRLNAGEELAHGDYRLRMQTDCNLVLYADNKAKWSTDTWNAARNCYLQLHSNGKLVLYGYQWFSFLTKLIQVWSSNVASNTKGNFALVLKYDGTFHVYGPVIWSKPNSIIKTSTDNSNLLSSAPSPSPAVDSTFWAGDIAPIGTIIANGDYKLELHLNCNLTLSNNKTNKTLWYSDSYDTYRLYDCFVSLGDNGELAINYLGGDRLWTSKATGPAGKGYVLVLRSDGNLAIYGPSLYSAPGGNGEKIAMVTELE